MASANTLLGPAIVPDGVVGDASYSPVSSTADDVTAYGADDGIVPDGTEWAVALLVVGALVFIVLFRVAGFQSVIAARVEVG